MKVRKIGVIMNGVTGRMGTNQHLIRSILAIRQQGGIALGTDEVIMPEPVLLGRNHAKIKALSEEHGLTKTSTDLDACLSDTANQIYFDAQRTDVRVPAVQKAIRAGKAVYCEKPVATTCQDAMELHREAQKNGVKNGVVQDKLWLPGILKIKQLIASGFFGEILSVRCEFGYWVFDGYGLAAQRPSWNYRKEDGGGIILDMFSHWRYLIDNLFARITGISCIASTHIARRKDENNREYLCTAEDAAYATLSCKDGLICQINSSWSVRVRRDDLLVLQIDGTKGTAVAGLRDCWIQPGEATPKPVWNPDVSNSINFYSDWMKVPDNQLYGNAFRVQWELFLKHVLQDEPFPWTLLEGAKGVQLAEKGMESWKNRCWVEIESIGG